MPAAAPSFVRAFFAWWRARPLHALFADAALAEVRSLWRGAEAVRRNPSLLSFLVRVSGIGIANETVGEGLARGVWDEAQLREIAARLPALLRSADLRFAIESERALMNQQYELWLASERGQRAADLAMSPSTPFGGPSAVATTAFWLLPRRIYRQNQLLGSQTVDRTLEIIPSDGARLDLTRLPAEFSEKESVLRKWRLWLSTGMLPSYEVLIHKSREVCARIELTRAGVARARHRKKHGASPESLAALVPEFFAAVPRDPFDGQPLRYRRTEDGASFRLYSVGKDGVDDGGSFDVEGLPDDDKDLIWFYAPRVETDEVAGREKGP